MSSHHCRCYVMRLPSFSPANELDMLSLSSCLSAAKKIANLNTNVSLLSVDGGCGVFGCVSSVMTQTHCHRVPTMTFVDVNGSESVTSSQ